MKAICLNFNSTLQSPQERRDDIYPQNLNITKEKIDYLVRLTDLIVLVVDYYTISRKELQEYAAYAAT